MKHIFAIVIALCALPAMAQSEPSTKEVLAAYCFGAISSMTQFIDSISDSRCAGDAACTAQQSQSKNRVALQEQKGQLFAYLSARGDPKRPSLQAAVSEGADDQTKCVWSDIKNKVGCSSFCQRRPDVDQAQCRSTCQKQEGSPSACAAAEKCADLSWLAP